MGKKILFIVVLLAAIIMEETTKAYAKGVSLMKKILFISILLFPFLISGTVMAYSINDPIGDQIGTGFEGYGIDIKNFTPGHNSGNIIFDLYTDYPQSGVTVGKLDN
jgi:hypothetical protein